MLALVLGEKICEKNGRYLIIIFIIGLFLIPNIAFAKGIEITNLDTNDHSNTMSVDDTSFENLTIDTNVTFYEKNPHPLAGD